jgi:hypothetical protein
MTDPESDELFRARLLRVVDDIDRRDAMVGVGPQLDRLGRKYDVYRTGVPLKGFDGFRDDIGEDDA